MSLSGTLKVAQQLVSSLNAAAAVNIPVIPESPPIGMAGKFSPTGVEGHLVITADTLRTLATL